MIFDQCLSVRYKKHPEVLKWLISHERKQLAINNCCQQVAIAEKSRKNKFNSLEMAALIAAASEMFARAALNAHEAFLMSEAERNRRQKEVDEIKEIETSVKEIDRDKGNDSRSGSGNN